MPCTNCRALELRIEHLEADEDVYTTRIDALERKLARTEAELSRARALCKRMACDVATLGGVLSGRLEPDALGAPSCN